MENQEKNHNEFYKSSKTVAIFYREKQLLKRFASLPAYDKRSQDFGVQKLIENVVNKVMKGRYDYCFIYEQSTNKHLITIKDGIEIYNSKTHGKYDKKASLLKLVAYKSYDPESETVNSFTFYSPVEIDLNGEEAACNFLCQKYIEGELLNKIVVAKIYSIKNDKSVLSWNALENKYTGIYKRNPISNFKKAKIQHQLS